MIFYKDYDFSGLFDRPDLVFSPYIAALDIQYAHNLPYLWTFCFDSCVDSEGNAIIIGGRTFEDLIDFLEIMKQKLHFSNGKRKHYLVIIVDDLFTFFGNTKKVMPYDAEPFVAKSGSNVLLASLLEVYQLHSYKAYFETEVEEDMLGEHGIILPQIDTEGLSPRVKLTEEEIENSENRVFFMANVFRQELDLKYQGLVNALPLTKTSRVNHLFYLEERAMSNKAKCNLALMIMKKNPLTSDYGREYILPMLFKAFFGGSVFFEEGVPDKAFSDVWSVDATSAYVARMVLSRYPIGKFTELPLPKSYKDLFEKPYSRYAMLITFQAEGVELRKGGLAFLPSQMRNHWTEKENAELELERCADIRIRNISRLHMTLTDIDFKLFLENYKPKRILIENIIGSKYGYLPDYVINVILRLYSNKAEAKQKQKELEELGLDTPATNREYERIKSELARLYGIFTKRPVMERYIFDTVKKEPKVVDHHYISPTAKFQPVLYQWGVWTTALVRKEISDLRRQLLNAPKDRKIKVLSGDTDNINYIGEATDIISRYNDNVKLQIEKRAAALGVPAELLKDLGALTVKKYKKYKLTALTQYCFIQDTENGEKFKFKVGGMNSDCEFFEKEFKTPLQRFDYFHINAVIPSEYKPRIVKIPVNANLHETWTDRDGNFCEGDVLSYVKETFCKFTLCPADMPDNDIKPGEAITLNEIKQFASKIRNQVFDPAYYYNRKKVNK